MERWNKSKTKKDEDFQEEEIWSSCGGAAAGKDKESSRNSKPKKTQNSSCSRIPNLSKKYSSAPMSIPDWSKNIHNYNMGSFEKNNDSVAASAAADTDDYEVDMDEMVPPHEIVANRVARSPIVSYSMCEGVGGTLKGRDLSKLRNSILTKTGFLE